MDNATLASGDVGAAYFFVRYGRDGRAVLMRSLRSEAWTRTVTPQYDPELWLCRVGATLAVVDDYDPVQGTGYLRKCQPSDSVWSIVCDWQEYRTHQRALRKAHRRPRVAAFVVTL
jgi:hypothetical protein